MGYRSNFVYRGDFRRCFVCRYAKPLWRMQRLARCLWVCREAHGTAR
jgi:hypothetical protein